MALEVTVQRVVANARQSGRGPGPEASMLKISGTAVQQALTELMVEADRAARRAVRPAVPRRRTRA